MRSCVLKTQTHITRTHAKQHTFYLPTINLTQIKFDQEEEKLISLVIDYAIEKPVSCNIKQLINEIKHAIRQLDEHLSNEYPNLQTSKTP